MGLYVTTIDVAAPSSPVISTPVLVAEVGQNIPEFGVVQSLSVSDPINNNGQLVFWATTTGGDQAIVKAQPALLPLVFIPGGTGSELTVKGKRLWFSIFPSDIQDLNLRTGSPDVVATDIVRRVFVIPVYARMVEYFTSHGYTEFQLNNDRSKMTINFPASQTFSRIPNLFHFPYDWRKSNASHTEELHQYISNIKRLHGVAKVNILANSQGGLVARNYILAHPEDVDRLVTVGVPFWGIPRTLYQMLTGEMLSVWGLVYLNGPEVKAALATFPGIHETLPSNYYLKSTKQPMMSEDRWDINGKNGSIENYTIQEYKDFIDDWVRKIEIGQFDFDIPSLNNDIFHSAEQDDWSTDNTGIKYLHITGTQSKEKKVKKTTVGVVAREKVVYHIKEGVQYVENYFDPIYDEGDGTVPLLSAERPEQFLAPPVGDGLRTQTYPVSWVSDHISLMKEPIVLSAIDAFLQDAELRAAPAQVSRLAFPAGEVAAQRIEIAGVGYVRVFDSLGNTNLQLSEIAFQTIPNVDIQYGDNQPWVHIHADNTVDLTIQGTPSDPPLQITVIQYAQDRTALSLKRYQFAPRNHLWQAHIQSAISSAGNPIITVDMNSNGTYEVNEQVEPSNSSGTGVVDVTPPFLNLSLSINEDSIGITLSATDNVSTNPSVRYLVNGVAVQNYLGPLTFPSNQDIVVKAFATDDMGNTSGMITTSLRPKILVEGSVANSIVLEWPLAEAYVLEETTDLVRSWTQSTAQITRNAFTASTAIPIENATRVFFRLRARTVTK